MKLLMALKTVSALLAALILCSCARPVSDKYPSDTGGASGTASSVSSSRVETTEAAPSETSKTEPSQPPQQDNTTSQTSADESDSIDAPAPESEFYLPEEFFESLNEIFDKYSINQNCDPGSDPCGCVPEYEEMGEDGSVIVPRDRVVSIYFLDTQSGYELSVNPGVHFPVASTVKIPFCVYIYQKLTDGEIDPNMILTYEKRHYFGGTGVIVKGDFGQQFTVLELLKLSITESDNVAYEMLKDLVPWEEFEEFLAGSGCTHPEDIRSRQQKICAESAGAYGRVLADFLTGDSPYVETFKADLLVTKNKMIKSSYPVYRKYGWTQFAFHDIAYIDAPHPYVLAVLTNLEGEDDSDYALYKEISYLFEEYSQAFYENAAAA